MNKPSLSAEHHFKSGVKVTSNKVIGESIFTMTRLDKAQFTTLVYKQGEISRELLIFNAHIVGITAIGNWFDLGRVYQNIIQQYRIYPWQLALFRYKGELWLEPEKTDLNANAIVCLCTGVTRAVLNRAVADGVNSATQLAKCTGASLVCGACTPLLTEIAGCSGMQEAKLVGVVPLTTDVKAFLFRPKFAQVKTYLAGQHIQIEAQIDGRWVQRFYTLTSSAQQQDYYEITVKREDKGLFSNWLHNTLDENSKFRISEPLGQFHINPKTNNPIVFFAGGIGITPALSILRFIKHQQRLLYIEYSTARQNQIYSSTRIQRKQ